VEIFRVYKVWEGRRTARRDPTVAFSFREDGEPCNKCHKLNYIFSK